MTQSLPDPQSILAFDELTRTSPSAHYYGRRKLNVALTKYRMHEDFYNINKALDESSKIVDLRARYLREISKSVWTAATTEAEIKRFMDVNRMDVAASERIKTIEQKISTLGMAYYIDENGTLNRGYVVNDHIVDDKNPEHAEMLKFLDEMFHSWLVSHGMASDENGILHRTTKDGSLADPVSSDDVRKLLENAETGFELTVRKIVPNIDELSMVWSPPELVKRAEQEQAAKAPHEPKRAAGPQTSQKKQ